MRRDRFRAAQDEDLAGRLGLRAGRGKRGHLEALEPAPHVVGLAHESACSPGPGTRARASASASRHARLDRGRSPVARRRSCRRHRSAPPPRPSARCLPHEQLQARTQRERHGQRNLVLSRVRRRARGRADRLGLGAHPPNRANARRARARAISSARAKRSGRATRQSARARQVARARAAAARARCARARAPRRAPAFPEEPACE